ncbi:unnamed protein product [Protopolystoma xenopodis]|uniref:Uncharacterized protein n=1 Tax=Protopolystoma xenopodis TaxID=117903 RepID=A0A448WIG3_9PLAT|nr:unnamed protein product [Protopolystoma xenopodis]
MLCLSNGLDDKRPGLFAQSCVLAYRPTTQRLTGYMNCPVKRLIVIQPVAVVNVHIKEVSDRLLTSPSDCRKRHNCLVCQLNSASKLLITFEDFTSHSGNLVGFRLNVSSQLPSEGAHALDKLSASLSSQMAPCHRVPHVPESGLSGCWSVCNYGIVVVS